MTKFRIPAVALTWVLMSIAAPSAVAQGSDDQVWAALAGARYLCPPQSLPPTQYGAMYVQDTVVVSGRDIQIYVRLYGPGERRGGGEMNLPPTTLSSTGTAGSEALFPRNQQVGPHSALIEGTAVYPNAAPMLTCPRQ